MANHELMLETTAVASGAEPMTLAQGGEMGQGLTPGTKVPYHRSLLGTLAATATTTGPATSGLRIARTGEDVPVGSRRRQRPGPPWPYSCLHRPRVAGSSATVTC